MALLFAEGFERISTSILASGTIPCKIKTASTFTKTTPGRFGGSCLRLSYGSTEYLYFYLPQTISGGSIFYASFAFKVNAFSSGVDGTEANDTFMFVYDPYLGSQFGIRLKYPGALGVFNSNTQVGSWSDNVINADTWHTIEVKASVGNSGSVIIRVDGNEALSVSGDVQNQSTDAVSLISFRNYIVGYIYLDDVIIFDATGSVLNDFVGPVKIDALYPNADTAQKDFSRSAGSDNYALVDEDSADSATTYTQSTAVGQVDLFDVTTLDDTPTSIYGISVDTVAVRSAADVVGHTQVMKSGSAIVSGESVLLGDVYKQFASVWTVNPDDSAAWEKADIDALQIGYKRMS